MIIMIIVSIAYFFGVLFSIKAFGWIGLAVSYGIGVLGFLLSSRGELVSADRTWLIAGPLGVFMAGGIAAAFIALPLQMLGIISSPSHYVSDDDFWSHR